MGEGTWSEWFDAARTCFRTSGILGGDGKRSEEEFGGGESFDEWEVIEPWEENWRLGVLETAVLGAASGVAENRLSS